MTDEECLEYIENCLDDDFNYKNATREKDKLSYSIILNLIEKQSKEIEELKEKNEYLPSWVGKKYISKDKIKAKIEEIDKVLNGDIYVIDGHYDDRYYRYLQDKHILQSLLEKE